jgi:peptidylprolyl isomerase
VENNNLGVLGLAGAGLLAAIAIGFMLKGTDEPATEAPADAVVDKVEAAKAVKPSAPPGARDVPTAPEALPAAGYQSTASGLQWFDITVGTGELPIAGSVVVVEYTGFLEDGKVFDSSYKRPDAFSFPVKKGNVIKGWDEGVATMKVGGKRQLKIPADLAYGERGAGAMIGPGATLVFDVELLEIKEPRVAPDGPQAVDESAFTITESGLKYHDFVKGTGPSPVIGQNVEVDYTGWLTDGTKFDSSLDRGKGIVFPVGAGRVIKGWDEGLLTMSVGGKRQLVIPADIAYGDRGRPPVIAPGATLVFEVELLSIK